ncbi:MAG: alkaline phosphatase [Marinomonas sp.]
MTIFHRSSLVIAVAALPLGACSYDQSGQSVASTPAPVMQQAEAPKKAKNVILFIGDGMGISTITAARIYAGQKRGQTGEEYVLPFEKFENVALVKTYNTNAQVADSAGTATAMHSGKKTKIGVLGVGPGVTRGDCASGLANELPLLGEQVKGRGMALGIVSTARITHATPASVYARAADRNWEADAAIPEGERGKGCDDIASQLIASDFDVALGGGRRSFFGKDMDGRRLEAGANLPGEWTALKGGTYVEDLAALTAAPMGKPVLGLFSPSHMTYMAEKTGDKGASEPTLTQMTSAAMARIKDDPDGYYLMVESGRIDHGHHAGKAGFALEEADEFANAIQYAIDNTHPAETLILVTADHSHVFTIAGYPRRGNDILGLVVPPSDGGDEVASAAKAKDGKPYTTLGYGNGPGSIANMAERPMPETGIHAQQQSAIPTGSETHAGEDVALYGNGPGADRVRGVIEQNLVYDIIVKALGWEK